MSTTCHWWPHLYFHYYNCYRYFNNSRLRKLSEDNIQTFKDSLRRLNWNEVLDTDDVTRAYDTFVFQYLYLYDIHCPEYDNKLTRKSVKKPQMTRELLKLCKMKQLLYVKFLKEKSVESEMFMKVLEIE